MRKFKYSLLICQIFNFTVLGIQQRLLFSSILDQVKKSQLLKSTTIQWLKSSAFTNFLFIFRGGEKRGRKPLNKTAVDGNKLESSAQKYPRKRDADSDSDDNFEVMPFKRRQVIY